MKKFIMQLGAWIGCLVEDHKLVRRTIIIWAMWLITYVVLKATEKMTSLDTPTVSFILGVIGILGTTTVFYIRMRELDDRDRK